MISTTAPFTLQQIGTGTSRFPSGVALPTLTDASVDPYIRTRPIQTVQVDCIEFWPQEKGTYPGIVLLHEFGHCAGARAVDGDAHQILMWPLGGLAAIEVPHTPRANFMPRAGINYRVGKESVVRFGYARYLMPAQAMRDTLGAFLLGARHGASCLGCCWALMAVLVLVGMMGVGWVVGLTIVVALEKLTTRGVAVSRLTGVALLVAAIIQGVR